MKHPTLTRCFLTLALWLLSAMAARGELTLIDTNEYKLSFYGFIKLDATYQDDGMNSQTAPRFARAGEEQTSFTTMHSRFGFKWQGPQLDNGLKVGAVLEWDLFDASRNQMDFRTRLVALTLQRGRSTWLFGQHWDIFSPLNVTTLMTNGNFWQTGNLGFRRAQIRYSYAGDHTEVALSVNDPTESGLSESGVPLVEARVGWKFAGRGRIGFSAAYGVDERDLMSGEEDVDIRGLSLDWILPFGKHLSFKGEAATGENLRVFLSRSATFTNASGSVVEGQEVFATWGQLLYSSDRLLLWLGGATEELTEERQLSASTIEETLAFFLGFESKLGKGVRLGAEIASFESTLLDGTELEANQAILSALYGF